MRRLLTLTLALSPALFAQAVQTKATQAAMTPQHALELLQQGNRRFVAGKPLRRNLVRQRTLTEEGQYPFAAILSCIDSRVSSELIFDQGIGDLFNARVAGDVENDDILGSLEYATKVAGSKLVVVLGHTHCGAVKGAVDDVHLGHITSLVGKIKPAVELVSVDGPRTSANHELVDKAAEINARRVARQLLVDSPVLRELVEKKAVRVVAAMHDLHTGQVRFFEE